MESKWIVVTGGKVPTLPRALNFSLLDSTLPSSTNQFNIDFYWLSLGGLAVISDSRSLQGHDIAAGWGWLF